MARLIVADVFATSQIGKLQILESSLFSQCLGPVHRNEIENWLPRYSSSGKTLFDGDFSLQRSFSVGLVRGQDGQEFSRRRLTDARFRGFRARLPEPEFSRESQRRVVLPG